MSIPSSTVTKNVLTSLSAYIWLPAFLSEKQKPCPKEHTCICILSYPKRVVDRELIIPPLSHITTDAILICHTDFISFILCERRLVPFLKACSLKNKTKQTKWNITIVHSLQIASVLQIPTGFKTRLLNEHLAIISHSALMPECNISFSKFHQLLDYF